MIRSLAVLAAVFVTLLWSSSYILNQYAFAEGIGPFTLAGLRYSAAVLALWAIVQLRDRGRAAHTTEAAAVPHTTKRLGWKFNFILGLTGFLLAQGLQYAGQYFVTPTQTSMVLSLGNTLFLLMIDAIWLRELKSRTAFLAILAAMGGVVLYYYPWHFAGSSVLGIILILLSCIGYAVHLAVSRYLLTRQNIAPSTIVLKPMLIGAIGMLATGFILEGIPPLSIKLLLILFWLGPVNGALAFTLWAWSQKLLRAYESSLINNLMLLQVAVMDIVFLSRSITYLQIVAMVIVGAAIVFVQLLPFLRKPRNQ